jgi:hypothetical protein
MQIRRPVGPRSWALAVALGAVAIFLIVALLSDLAPDQVAIRVIAPNGTTTITYGIGASEHREVVQGSWSTTVTNVKRGDLVHVEVEAHSPNADVACEIYFDGNLVVRKRSDDPPFVSCSAVRQ